MFRSLLKTLLILVVTTNTAFAFPHGGGSNSGGGGGGGDPTAGIIPSYNDVYANWSVAGLALKGGIPDRTTQCGATVTPSNLTPPAANDDAVKIQAAIDACTAGQFVQLGTGNFVLAQGEVPILVNKGITVRGSGSPGNTCGTLGGSMCWPTTITVRDGAISNWLVSTTQAGGTCGVSPTSLGSCSASSAVFLLSPSSIFNWGWAACGLGTTPTGCGATLTADAAAGSTTVNVSSTANFSVGMFVLIDEDPAVVSSTNPTGGAAVDATPEWSDSTGSPVTARFEGGDEVTTYSFNPNRLNSEIKLITAIGSGTITFDTPLTQAFRSSGSHDARVYWPTVQGSNIANPFVQQAGIENLSIDRPSNGGISMVFCAYCWVKNVEVGHWIAGAVNMTYSIRSQVEGLFAHDCTDCENNGVEYPLAIDTASSENLVENSIIVRGGKGMVGRGSASNVIAYNYVDQTRYMSAVIGDYWVDMGLNGTHYAGTHHWLFEGNLADNCDGDETHGSASYHTFFRNDCMGVRTDFVDDSAGNYPVSDINGTGFINLGTSWSTTQGSTTLTTADSTFQLFPGATVIVPDITHGYWEWVIASGSGTTYTMTTPAQFTESGVVLGRLSNGNVPLRAAGPMALNYWYAYAGNVLGLSGVTTTGNGWAYSGTDGKDIWNSGWVGSEFPGPDTRLSAGVSPNWLFKAQNYDYVTNSLDSTSGYTATLPDSFFLTGVPSFFTGTNCTYPWPWVTPTSATKLQQPTGASCTATSGLPAKARFDAGTPFVQP